MPTDTDDNSTTFLFLIVSLTILTTVHVAYIFYHRVIWGESWVNNLSTVAMVFIYIIIIILSVTVATLPDTSDYGVSIFFYLGTLLPLFNIGIYAYSYYYFKVRQGSQQGSQQASPTLKTRPKAPRVLRRVVRNSNNSP